MSIDDASQLAFSIFCTVDFLPEDIRMLEWTRSKISGEFVSLAKQKMIDGASSLHEQPEHWDHTIPAEQEPVIAEAGRLQIISRFATGLACRTAIVGRNAGSQSGIARIRMDSGRVRERRFDGTRFPTASGARRDFSAEFDRPTSTNYFPPPGTPGFGRITGSQVRQKEDSKLDAQREMNEKANRPVDNVFIERLWRSVKHEGVYLRAYKNVHELEMALEKWFSDYNHWKQHRSQGYQTPWECYRPKQTPAWEKAA